MTDYLSDLSQWQAMSHPLLAERKPEELFSSDVAGHYRRLHNHLYQRILRLHGTIHTVEQLSKFPFSYLYAPHNMEFWHLVMGNFIDTAILMLHGLVKDTGTDDLSIHSFRNKIMQWTWVDAHLKKVLKEFLRDKEFDPRIKAIAQRVKIIRDTHIAHSPIDRESGEHEQPLAGISLDELRRLFDASHSLFGALCFGSAYVTLAGDLAPATVGGKPTRTCLDEVLDAVLRVSHFVNQPERKQAWWPEHRKRMSPDTLQVMNELRKRIGLPEA
jgi:hypothetical protein